MTTLTVVRAGLFALTLVALGFVPGVSVANPPSATGHGDFLNEGQLRAFSFSAIQQPNGKVAGQAEVHNRTTGVVVHMDINCLNFVAPNTVVLSGIITNSNDPTMEGRTVAFIAQDNGEGTNSPSDKLSMLAFANCSDLLVLDLFDIQHGNIQVRPSD